MERPASKNQREFLFRGIPFWRRAAYNAMGHVSPRSVIAPDGASTIPKKGLNGNDEF
jgi:hypothetical protein